jgi:nitrogen PTS system EIIA component
MKITDFLTPEMICPALGGETKVNVLKELAACLTGAHPEIPSDELAAVLAERERLGSTAIGDGIAIPHGKLPSVTKILGTFGRHVSGVDFESLDGNPTHIFFMLVAPEDSTSLHLKALARVSRLLRDGNFRDKLLTAPDANELFRLIRDEDSKF